MYSVIIPVYNEEKRIHQNIGEIFAFFSQQPVEIEIIFVNDGSDDKTREVLSKFQMKYSFQVVDYKKNRGKGYAIRRGVEKASGDWIVFFDVDLATPLVEFNHLLNFFLPNDQVIIGSRRQAGSDIKRGESKIRVFLGQGFTFLSNILVWGITDFTCGFKCFSKEAARKIFPLARIERWGFDTELLYIARLKNIPIREMPVAWAHDDNSRVNVLGAIVSSLWELAQMKLNQIKGFYK
jgi:dolichyl-phosphate beta-glucosyltransferase